MDDYIVHRFQVFFAFLNPPVRVKHSVSMSEAQDREPFEVTEESLSEILDVSEAETATAEVDSSAEVSAETTDTETSDEPEIIENPEQVEPEKPEEPEASEEPEKEEPEEDLTVKDGDKVYSFKDAPKAMREVFEAKTKLVKSFVHGSGDFITELQEISPSSFEKFARDIVQQSAESAPQAWADFLAKSNPDTVLSALLGTVKTEGDDFTGANPAILAELYRLMNEDSEAGEMLRFELESRDENLKVDQKPKLSPEEQKELDDYRQKQKEESEQKEVKERRDTYEKVMTHIETEVVAPLVEKFGLMPKDSDSKDEQQAKIRLLNSLPQIFDNELLVSDVKADYAKMLEKINAKDLKGAMVLAPSVMEEVERIALSYLGFITNKRTASIKQETTSAKKAPPTLTPSNPVPPPPPKPMTLSERLETATDDEILRNMGLR